VRGSEFCGRGWQACCYRRARCRDQPLTLLRRQDIAIERRTLSVYGLFELLHKLARIERNPAVTSAYDNIIDSRVNPLLIVRTA
jgi:hypothetical protein